MRTLTQCAPLTPLVRRAHQSWCAALTGGSAPRSLALARRAHTILDFDSVVDSELDSREDSQHKPHPPLPPFTGGVRLRAERRRAKSETDAHRSIHKSRSQKFSFPVSDGVLLAPRSASGLG